MISKSVMQVKKTTISGVTITKT